MDLSTIENLLNEISYLKKKANVLDEILKYYDRETMTFDIPEKWSNTRVFSLEVKQKTPASPRHRVARMLEENLPYSEVECLIDWDRLHETVASIENKKQ